MWSVVEKTALAEAEIEYEEYTSDRSTSLPVEGDDASRSSSGPRPRGRFRAIARSPFPADRLRPLPRDRAPAETGRRSARPTSSRNRSPTASSPPPKSGATNSSAQSTGTRSPRCSAPTRSRHGYGFVVPLIEGDHVSDEAGTGFVHTAPSHGREDFELWMANGRWLAEHGIDSASPTPSTRTAHVPRRRPGSRACACITDKGEKGDGERSRDQGARRGGRPARARPAQAPVSAQLALEEAGHLPQYAAMVSGDGPTLRQCAQRHDAEGDRARGDRETAGFQPPERTASRAW